MTISYWRKVLMLDSIQEFVENQNSKNGLWRIQFNLGHLLTFVGIIIVVIPMWYSQVANDVESRRSLNETKDALQNIQQETKVSLDEIKLHLNSIDKTTTMSLVDDDRLLRVQEDIKSIQGEIQQIQSRLNAAH
jgi:peptidoglycan hydrolase CwlO-like protein